MAESWVEFAGKVSDDTGKNQTNLVGIAEVDCTQHAATCSHNGIQGYPTLKLFVKGHEAVKYQQARTIEAFTAWLDEQKAKLIPGANVEQKT